MAGQLQQLYLQAGLALSQNRTERWSYRPMKNLHQLSSQAAPRPTASADGDGETKSISMLDLCEPEAATLLFSMPNPYWFLTLLCDALLTIPGAGVQERLSAANVAEAAIGLRLEYGAGHDLDTDLADMTAADQQARLQRGLIIDTGAGRIINPLFAPCPGAETNSDDGLAAITAMLRRYAVAQSEKETAQL